MQWIKSNPKTNNFFKRKRFLNTWTAKTILHQHQTVNHRLSTWVIVLTALIKMKVVTRSIKIDSTRSKIVILVIETNKIMELLVKSTLQPNHLIKRHHWGKFLKIFILCQLINNAYRKIEIIIIIQLHRLGYNFSIMKKLHLFLQIDTSPIYSSKASIPIRRLPLLYRWIIYQMKFCKAK